MSRRRFGALTGIAAGMVLVRPAPAAAQQVRGALKVGSGVAANPQDLVVRSWSSTTGGGRYLLVMTVPGEVYAHKVSRDGQVGAPWRVGAVRPRNDETYGFFADAPRGCIYMLRAGGGVLSFRVDAGPNGDPIAIAPEAPVRVPSPVAAGPQDRLVMLLADRFLVSRADGISGVHRIESATQWSAGRLTAPDSARLFANPRDRWAGAVCGDRIGVITTSGDLYVHRYDFARDAVLPATRATTAQPVGTDPQVRFMAAAEDTIYVVSRSGDVYAHSIAC